MFAKEHVERDSLLVDLLGYFLENLSLVGVIEMEVVGPLGQAEKQFEEINEDHEDLSHGRPVGLRVNSLFPHGVPELPEAEKPFHVQEKHRSLGQHHLQIGPPLLLPLEKQSPDLPNVIDVELFRFDFEGAGSPERSQLLRVQSLGGKVLVEDWNLQLLELLGVMDVHEGVRHLEPIVVTVLCADVVMDPMGL